jgi:regulator of protease activity HflC (stomatin/prohibitin superfamily)
LWLFGGLLDGGGDGARLDEIRNVAARFSSFQFFYNRSDITLAMGKGLTESLDTLGASVSGFQLLNYDLPASFANSIQATQETGQQITKVTEEQTKTKINAEQQVATAKQDAEILVVQATAAGDAFVLEKTAERDAILVTLDNERAIYKNMKDTLSLSTEELLNLIWLSAVQSTAAPQMLNVPAPNGICNHHSFCCFLFTYILSFSISLCVCVVVFFRLLLLKVTCLKN